MKKLCFVFGTRPEAIKMAPVILLAQQQTNRFSTHVCVTGQHRQMLDQMLKTFDIVPDTDLGLMSPNQSLAEISVKTIQAVTKSLEEIRPDWILVQGDTTTVWAAAVAAFFLNIRVGHIEAGLRTNDKRQPFPEEINRRIASQIADLHFAPTKRSRDNLLSEAIPAEHIVVTGNTVVDALQWILAKNEERESSEVTCIREWIEQNTHNSRVVLITGHRRENFGKGFENICKAIVTLAREYTNIDWVYPVHLNPNVQKPVYSLLDKCNNVHLIKPQPYKAFVWLMNRSHFILTDSGGIQEEAPSLGKPVLVMRNTTERPEGVDAGVVKLVGNQCQTIVDNARMILTNDIMSRAIKSPYGDGKAAAYILDALNDSIV